MFLTSDSVALAALAALAVLTVFVLSSFGAWLAKRLRHQH